VGNLYIFPKISGMNNSFWDSTLGRFRLVAIVEGISYLILLGIAMPLKYFAELPEAVKYTGWIHGVLFVLYIALLLKVWIQYRWSFGKVVLAFIASLLPFGTFVLDSKLKKEQQAANA
jgi:integral membrane protein